MTWPGAMVAGTPPGPSPAARLALAGIIRHIDGQAGGRRARGWAGVPALPLSLTQMLARNKAGTSEWRLGKRFW